MSEPDASAAYVAAHDSIAVLDLSDRAQIELRGSDRQTFLNNFCTNDIKTLQPGDGCEAFVTSMKGRILGHIIVSAAKDALWIDSVPGASDVLVGHLDKYLITEDVKILDRTADMGPLCLVGPQSNDWMRERGIDVEQLPVWGQCSATLEGTDVLVRRVGFSVPLAFEIVVAHDQLRPLLETITAGGVPLGSGDVYDVLRIEAGFPHYGVDLSEENLAQEAGRNAQAISFTKGCYLGQEPIARLDALGHTNKELRCLKLAAGPEPEPGTSVHSTAGEDVGRIKSAGLSPADGLPVAMAMLKTSVTMPETKVVVGETSATVTTGRNERPLRPSGGTE